MTHTSCLRHPESSHYIQLHKWQKDFCQGNHCAAFLLSFFSCWHDWKILNDDYYQRYNNIAEAHGDGRPHIENAYLFFTMDDFVDGLMGLFGKKSISEGLKLLESLGVITLHKNPNPRYCFDKTKYFRFYPEICNQWLYDGRSLYQKKKNKKGNSTQVIDNYDNAEMDNRSCKNARPSSENGRPSRKNGQAITDNTNNTTNNNQSTNAREEISSNQQENVHQQDEIKPIVTALMKKGMSEKRFYPEAIEELHRLYQSGVTVEVFTEAYDLSFRATQGREFGVPYLVKVVRDILHKKRPAYSKDPPCQSKDYFSDTVYESDIRNALKWMKDEEPCKKSVQQ